MDEEGGGDSCRVSMEMVIDDGQSGRDKRQRETEADPERRRGNRSRRNEQKMRESEG